jgi:hypothetical protein
MQTKKTAEIRQTEERAGSAGGKVGWFRLIQ